MARGLGRSYRCAGASGKRRLCSEAGDPFVGCGGDDVAGERVVVLAEAVGVRDFGLAPVAEEEELAAGGGVEAGGVVEVVLFHHQDDVGPARDLRGELACAVGREVDAAGEGDGLGVGVGGVADEGAGAGGGDGDGAATFRQALAQDGLGKRAATDVAGAEGEDLFEHARIIRKSRRPLARASAVAA